jgi:hypothetical protein
MEGFSSNFTQMFTSTGQCAEPILPLCQLKVKAILEGQKLTYKMFLVHWENERLFVTVSNMI